MKQRHLSLVLAAFIAMGTISVADSGQQNQSPQVPVTLVKINRGASVKRPKAPDRQVVTCAYDGESLHLTFVIPEGSATLSVTDGTLLTSTYEIDTTPLAVSVPVGELVGSVSIEMETEYGSTFTGVLE